MLFLCPLDKRILMLGDSAQKHLLEAFPALSSTFLITHLEIVDLHVFLPLGQGLADFFV